MRWRRTAEAGLLLLAGLLNKAGVTLAEEEDGFQRRLSGKTFERSSDRRSTGAKHPRKGGGGRGHGGMAAKAPLPIEDGCPYAIETEEEATLRVGDTSLPGNVVTVEHLAFCRTGNHFINVIRNLAVGYCCKSRVLWLPPKDDVLAPGIFSEGTPGPRWFDFSGAPDVPGFNSSSCSADITWAGQRAFHMYQRENHEFYNPGLLKCVARAPRLLGCEAAYYFPKDIDICSASAAPPASDREHEAKRLEKAENPAEMGRQLDLGLSGGENGGQTTTTGTVKDTRWRVQEEASSEWKDGDDWDDGGGDGTLVLHVRSGDIFDDEILAYYGQPPLQFYVRTIEHANWDRVDVVTNGQDEKNLNPVIPALREKVATGKLPSTVHFHTNRSMDEDLRSMFCADGLVLARSTLVSLTGYHSKAKRVYGPIHRTPTSCLLQPFRREKKTYGVVWPGRYSIYVRWENTPYQRKEMLSYNKISGFSTCSGERA
ncbi:unnamed protein product [Scytosiphon promiscuus]